MTKVRVNPALTRSEKLEIVKQRGWVYNPDTGQVTSSTGKVWDKRHSNGYIFLIVTVKISGKKFSINVSAHQFAWYVTYGEVPEEIDHINRIRHDNRILNLRNVSRSGNCQNINHKGYFWSSKHKKWQAKIEIDGKQINLGLYDKEEDARSARLKAESIRDAGAIVYPKPRKESKGYNFNKKTKKYYAYIIDNGKQTHLGAFDTATEAKKAYNSAKTLRNNNESYPPFKYKGYTKLGEGRYQANIKANGKQIYLGIHTCIADAEKAYLQARKLYFPNHPKTIELESHTTGHTTETT